MIKQSAGLLVFRRGNAGIEVLLVHPGGPFWAQKDKWSVPKGEVEPDEDLMMAGKREFAEEVGVEPPSSALLDLGSSKQSGKTNFIWAVEGEIDLKKFKSNTFTMEWPPKSGQQQTFPEADRGRWFDLGSAKRKLFQAQIVFIDRLAEALDVSIEVKSEPEQQSLL